MSMWRFIAASFIVAKNWKWPGCSSIGDWINKSWYIHIEEYYPKLKRYELFSHGKTGWILNVLVTKKGQSYSSTIQFPIIWLSNKGKTIQTLNCPVVSRIEQMKHRGFFFFFLEKWNYFIRHHSNGYLTHEFIKIHGNL